MKIIRGGILVEVQGTSILLDEKEHEKENLENPEYIKALVEIAALSAAKKREMIYANINKKRS